jgi:hypothetical protein
VVVVVLSCALLSLAGKRILETEMQAGPQRQDAGTVCRQYVVSEARGAIAGLRYRRSRRAGKVRRAGRVVVAAVEGGGGSTVYEPLWRVAERSHSGSGREETGGFVPAKPCQDPGCGAGDLSTSTTLPTRYLLSRTRLSRPPESRHWGEARGQTRART